MLTTLLNMVEERTGASSGLSPDAARSRSPRVTWPAFWGAMPLALVALALFGSVAFPARQTWRIMRLLAENSQVLAPARLLVEQLQVGLASERVALQSYALSGDPALLGRYELTAADDQRRLARLDLLAGLFDSTAARHLRGVQSSIADWHLSNATLIAEGGAPDRFRANLQDEQARYDASVDAATDLSLVLSREAEGRVEKVRSLENLSIIANAALVLAALIAMYGVAVLTLRERRLTAALRRRIDEEFALREAAEALGEAYTVEEVTKLIAQTALLVVKGACAFVELVESPVNSPQQLVVRASAGTGAPPLGTTCMFADSSAERAIKIGNAMLFKDLASPQQAGAVRTMLEAGGSAIVVPLGGDATPRGALFVVSTTPGQFTSNDVMRAGIFGHLAALSYEKNWLLEESQERRRVLERVIQSRSRLMRGFSHDVKNPIGAADGFAELMAMGVYGDVSVEQRASIGRMRRNIHSALTLIDDLHELARAETGHLALANDQLDLAAFTRDLGEEYQAVAQGRGLGFSVVTDDYGPIVPTDRARVRQIVANLVSNAIKYTEHGSITIRSTWQATGPDGVEGEWAAVQVTDSGIGIAADKQQFIFEEFSRVGSSDATGAGLGLAISALIVRGLGGHISVDSELGQGSTFTLWLPLDPTTLPFTA